MRTWTAALTVAAASTPAAAANIYTEDFSSEPGTEWSATQRQNHSSLGWMLGNFNNEAVSLTLDTSNAQTYTVTFDLLTLGSWNGLQGDHLDDIFTASVNGTTALTAIIDIDLNHEHTFDDPDLVLNPDSHISTREMLFRDVSFTFTAEGDEAAIEFFGNASGSDERFAMDNVRVTQAGPIPAAPVAATLAIAGLYATRRRR